MNVTATLLLSLKQDIDVLNKLVQDIPKSQEVAQLRSWLFPSKTYDFINPIIDDKISKTVSYQNCLEVTLDRLYVISRLIILYINDVKLIKDVNKEIIFPPNRLTLGCCVNLLWKCINTMIDQKTSTKPTKSLATQKFCDKKTQTDIISLNTCDSCSTAILCMKNLLNFFKEQDGKNERFKIKYNVFEITQFGSMLKVASSIEDSLNTLYKQLHQKTVETDLLKSENEKCLSNLDIHKSKIKFLEAEVNILRDKLDEDIQKIESLGQEKNKLVTENYLQKNEIKSLNHIIDNLNLCLTSAQEENKVFKRQNNSLVDIVERSKVLSRYALQLHKKIAHLDKEQESVKCIIDQYEKSVNYLNIKFIKLPRNMEKIDLKIKYRYESMKELLQDFSKYEEFCLKTKRIFKEKLEKNKEKNETAPEVFKIKGNPVEDLTKQIEENENKIRTLKNENHKLQELLARFKSIKAS